MRLIDADALRDELLGKYAFTEEEDCIAYYIDNAPTIDAVPVVRCKDCIYYHKRHVLLDDGTEVDYDSEIVKEYLKSKRNDCLFDGYVGSDLGINVGGKCEYDKNNGYIEDKTVHRNEDDFCSKGKRTC